MLALLAVDVTERLSVERFTARPKRVRLAGDLSGSAKSARLLLEEKDSARRSLFLSDGFSRSKVSGTGVSARIGGGVLGRSCDCVSRSGSSCTRMSVSHFPGSGSSAGGAGSICVLLDAREDCRLCCRCKVDGGGNSIALLTSCCAGEIFPTAGLSSPVETTLWLIC
jgi:hypothetical protein